MKLDEVGWIGTLTVTWLVSSIISKNRINIGLISIILYTLAWSLPIVVTRMNFTKNENIINYPIYDLTNSHILVSKLTQRVSILIDDSGCIVNIWISCKMRCIKQWNAHLQKVHFLTHYWQFISKKECKNNKKSLAFGKHCIKIKPNLHLVNM